MIDAGFEAKPRNRVVITLRQILDGSSPILYVAHDAEDGLQFLTGGDIDEGDVALVALHEVIDVDATVLEVVDISPGMIASRSAVDDAWLIEPLSEDN